MHARDLVELAALVALHAPALIRGQGEIPARSIEGYWVASKCRLDRWARDLKHLGSGKPAPKPRNGRAPSPPAIAVMEEILTGEALTRVWGAAMAAYDRSRGIDLAEPIARSVLLGHMEARHRVLMLLVGGPGLEPEEALRVNHVRCRAERWTDVLVAHMAQFHDIAEFAVDPGRARQFADDLAWQSLQPAGRVVRPLVLGSLRAAFRHGLTPTAANPDLNAKIAVSLLSCLPAETFDGTGVPQSLWLLRVSKTASDAQGMIDELLGPKRAARTTEVLPAPAAPARRCRRFGPSTKE